MIEDSEEAKESVRIHWCTVLAVRNRQLSRLVPRSHKFQDNFSLLQQ